MIDLHAHILPGLDDGAADWDEAVRMCRLAVADGITAVAATAHMCRGMFDVTRRQILEGVSALRTRLADEGIPLAVESGAEVHIETDLCDRLREGSLVTVADRGRHLLIELPRQVLPLGLPEFLFSVRRAGVTPIIAHPELNLEIQDDPGKAAELARGGNLMHVTSPSVTGNAGKRAEQCAHELLTRRLAHLVASDAHSPRSRRPELSRARAVVEELLSGDEAEEVFVRRPQRILAGETVDLPETVDSRAKKRKKWFSWKR
jgi:protein-tyrosine phosphatase